MTVSDTALNLIHRVNVGDTLTRVAWRAPQSVAIVDHGETFTYGELNSWVNRTAHGLLARGYERGDALALASGNSVEFLVTYYACAKIGVVCVPLNLGWKSHEMAYVLGHSKARGIVVENQLADAIAGAIAGVPAVADVIMAPGTVEFTGVIAEGRSQLTFAELSERESSAEPEVFVDDRDAITYLYTSGTTAAPKGVVGNHTAVYLESLSMALEGQFNANDKFVAMMPMFHTAQLNCHCTTAIAVGATMYIRRNFEAGALLQQIESEGITQIFGLPMMYREMLEHPAIESTDLSSLRRALYAMAPMPERQLRRCIEVFDCDFYLLFGQTEMSPTATIFRPEYQLTHNGAAGSPVANVQVAIMAPDGTLVPQGDEGEIVYRGPHVMTEYLDNPQATETAFEYGWFHSGDLGHFDTDGILWFTDRSKDMIKTGGENVSSMEVEKAVMHVAPGILEAVVVGLPHPRWSEAITVVAVRKAGADVDEGTLIESVKDHIDRYKAPKSVIFVDELPRTSTGKIQKNVVRERFTGHYDSSPA